jgi:hypothetical protein
VRGALAVAVVDVAASVTVAVTPTAAVMLVRRPRAAAPLESSSPSSVAASDGDVDVAVMLLLLRVKAVFSWHWRKATAVHTSDRLFLGLFAVSQNGIGHGGIWRNESMILQMYSSSRLRSCDQMMKSPKYTQYLYVTPMTFDDLTLCHYVLL